MEHCFGGSWTKQKLVILEKYLKAYISLFEGNERARKFRRIYVDGFAGTGSIFKKQEAIEQLTFSDIGEFEEFESDFMPGSAKLALELKPGFHRYYFIDANREHVEDLGQIARNHPDKDVKVIKADCNAWLQKWCTTEKWAGQRAVVFLDPYGMQVKWGTLEAIAKTKAIDLWLLFPLGQAVNRLLPAGKKPPEHWAKSLDMILGTGDWRNTFYRRTSDVNLFNLEEQKTVKCVSIEDVGYFFLNRLKEIFAGVAEEPMFLYNSSNCPIFLLCFAASNERGAKPAVGIAQDIIRKEFADGRK